MIVQAEEAAAPGPAHAWDTSSKAHVNGHTAQPAPEPNMNGSNTKQEGYMNSAHILPPRGTTLVDVFLDTYDRVERHLSGQPVTIDGYSLTIPDIIAASRYLSPVTLSTERGERQKVNKAERAIQSKLDEGKSVYGISTGYGGSADTRTHQYLALGKSLLQHQHCGVLPLSSSSQNESSNPAPPKPLPVLDPLTSLSMPESWVRAAIAIRTNSLIRGHSGVQWSTISAMTDLLNKNITPLVPLRGSISASGDLQPLSYVAGTLMANPGIRCYAGPRDSRQLLPAPAALESAGLKPHKFSAKDHLGILNGTAFSAATASLALYDTALLTLLAQACTAMGTEALKGVQASHHPFIHAVTRPHPGQVEAASNMWRLLEGSKLAVGGEEKEVELERDRGVLRQDRYPLRTSPQWIGPQVEEVLGAWATVTQECNSTTDNPLVDGETGHVHHGGNFQAMALTNAMEKLRLSLHHLGKLLFAQCTELLNPSMNRGLPPNLAGTDPSINYHCKGLDIACAAYVSELGYLANPVSTHVQSAELHNQAVNSLALISARKTLEAIDVLSLLTASYLYVLCQALDLRAQQFRLADRMRALMSAALANFFGEHVERDLAEAKLELVSDKYDQTSSMDARGRMDKIFSYCTTPLVDYFLAHGAVSEISKIPSFRAELAQESYDAYTQLRQETLAWTPQAGPAPASEWLSPRTRKIYEFVRLELGVRPHGKDNSRSFEAGFEGGTIGESVSRIYESLRDGRVAGVLREVFAF